MIWLAFAVVATVLVAREISHRAEVRRLDLLLANEQGRTGDLLTRLAARSLEQYHAVSAPAASPPVRHREYLTDPTGLIQVDVTED